MPQRGLCRAACRRLRCGGVEPVFEYVQVKGAQVFRAKNLQLGHHGVELVIGEVRQDVGLQLRRAAQCIAVNLQHVCHCDAVFGRVKVAHIGEQELQGVAHPSVGVHHAGQNLGVDVQVARIVGGRHPQAHDFGAHFFGDFLWCHGVAQAFAHFATLAVGGKPVGEQALVGCTVVQGAAQQQRAVEPAAVLVVAFEVEVGFRPLVMEGCTVVGVFVAATQHVLKGGAAVKPDFQDVGALGVSLRLVTRLAQDVFDCGAAPGLDAAVLHDVGCLVQDGHGAGVQFTAVFVQEKWHRYAPAALARDAPVGPVGNHVAQAGFAVFGVEARFFNRIQSQLAKGLGCFVFGEDARAFVHAHKPLGGCAVDHRRLVAPAVRVAVGNGVGCHQAVALAQNFNDAGAGFPDVHAAKQGQVVGITAIALHRVQDVVVLQAMGHAAVEVVHAIGG